MFAFFSPLPWLCAPVPSPLNLSASLGPSARHGPRIYRAPLACECAKLFGCGIFPHTGSRQSRLTGHWLHSITERPGLEKKKIPQKRQMSSLKPCATPSSLHPPHNNKGGRNCSFLFSQGGTRVCSYRALLRGAPRSFSSRATVHYLRQGHRPLPSQLSGRHNGLTNRLRINLPI